MPLPSTTRSGCSPSAAVIKDLGLPKAGLDFVDAHQRAGLAAPALGQPEVIWLHGHGFPVHHDWLGPETRDARAVFSENVCSSASGSFGSSITNSKRGEPCRATCRA